jgi:N-acetylmuramoyl-L-alanine amidase
MTQRRSYWGIIEDIWNVLVARELFELLDNDNRFDVFMNRDFNNNDIGESGRQKWMEASHLYLKRVGAPEDIWNVGASLNQAINADARGSRFFHADIAISIHANSGGGEARGHEVWHHSYANFGRKLSNKISDALEGMPNPSRGIKHDTAHDRLAFWVENQGRIMSVIEYFFYDNHEDNELMKLQNNINLCAQLTYRGVVDFIETYGHTIPWI